jgi:hypothetical protein
MVWTMFIMSHVCIARASLFTQFCPHVEDVKMGDLDSDGMPRWVVRRLKR